MAKEYIEREDAYDMLTEYYHHRTDAQHGALRDALSRVPAADVAPVVHARWIEDGDNQPMSCDKCYCCSNCHGNRRFEWQLKPFCSDCGAKMQGNRRCR